MGKTITTTDRRAFLRLGLAAIAAPAIVRASSLMAIKPIPIGDGAALWSVSHPFTLFNPPASLSNLLDLKDLNEEAIEELCALVRMEECAPNLFRPRIVRIVRPADADHWYGSHGE